MNTQSNVNETNHDNHREDKHISRLVRSVHHSIPMTVDARLDAAMKREKKKKIVTWRYPVTVGIATAVIVALLILIPANRHNPGTQKSNIREIKTELQLTGKDGKQISVLWVWKKDFKLAQLQED